MLHIPGAKYCKIQWGEKKPVGKAWQNIPYEFEQLQAGLSNRRHGYGILFGHGDIVGFDIDNAEGRDRFVRLFGCLPKDYPSVSWTSGKRFDGTYSPETTADTCIQIAFRLSPEQAAQLPGRRVFKGNTLDIRWKGTQSVLPSHSPHPGTKQPYRYHNSPDFSTVAPHPQEVWVEILKELYQQQPHLDPAYQEQQRIEGERRRAERQADRLSTGNLSDDLGDILERDILPRLGTDDIYNWSGHSWKQQGRNRWEGSCPNHQSKSGTAFVVNPSNNTWFCNGCDVGGGAVQYRWFVRGSTGTPRGKDFVEVVKELASDAGVELPSWKRQQPYRDRTPGNRQLTKEQWEEQYLYPRQWAEISRYIKETYDRAAWKFWRSNGHLPVAPKKNQQPRFSTTAIVLWRSPEEILYSSPYICRVNPGYLIYVPGELLAKEKWMELGSPDIIFSGGQRRELYREIYLKWDKAVVSENSATGQGKTHDVGELTAEWLTGSDKARIFYNDKQHKNPTTANIEQNYDDQVSRNDGQKYDYDRQTPNGFPHVVRTKDGEEPDILGNCPETKTFLLLSQDKNVPVHGGKGSPICENCTHYKNGKTVVCPFIVGRRDVLQNKTEIRQHLDQATVGQTVKTSGENGEEIQVPVDVFFLEEAASNLTPAKLITAPKKEVAFAFQELKSIEPALAYVVEPIFDAIYKLLNIQEIPLHGWDFSEILKQMPDIKVVIGQRLFEYGLEQFNKVGQAWYDSTTNVWDLEPDAENPELITISDLGKRIRRLLYPRLGQLFNKGQTPEKKQQIVRDFVALDWISLALGAIVENTSHLQINSEGLKITFYSAQQRSKLGSYKLVVLQDSTATKSELALKTRIKKSEILQIRQQNPSYTNLTVKVITGLGMCGKQRRHDSEFSLQERLVAFVEYIQALHPVKPIGVIDRKAAIPAYAELTPENDDLPPIIFGYWGRDNRASNAFIESRVLVLIGTPLPNLGDAAAEYHAQTGEVTRPTDWSGGFGRYLKNWVLAEVYQGGGRLRAHLKPNQQHTLYIVGNEFVTKEGLAAQYPGAKIEFVDVYNLCPEAAPKGVQREHATIVELFNALKDGIDATTAQVGERTGVHRTTASRVVTGALEKLGIQGGFNAARRVCSLFIESFKTKRTPPKLDEETQALVDYFLPTVYEGLIAEQQSEAQAAEEVLSVLAAYGAEKFKLALESVAPEVTGKLFSAWLTFLSPLLDLGECPAPAT